MALLGGAAAAWPFAAGAAAGEVPMGGGSSRSVAGDGGPLVRCHVAVIFTGSTPSVLATKAATTTTPCERSLFSAWGE